MRRTFSLVLAAAAAVAFAAPAAPAHAIRCLEPFDLVCETLCDVYQTLGRPCPR